MNVEKILFLLIICVLSGCHTIISRADESEQIVNHTEIVSINNAVRQVAEKEEETVEVTIKLEEDTFYLPIKKEAFVRAKIVNPTDTSYSYGRDFMIEFFKNGRWGKPTQDPAGKDKIMAFYADLKHVRPKSSEQSSFFFMCDWYIYVPGHYRFVKTLENEKTCKKKEVYAEFFVLPENKTSLH